MFSAADTSAQVSVHLATSSPAPAKFHISTPWLRFLSIADNNQRTHEKKTHMHPKHIHVLNKCEAWGTELQTNKSRLHVNKCKTVLV
ncbi:unnamed protein product [Linum trigynum]|uniref:Uncharacterized protein n=1 Tax=Linum trigynum TaxID=586398 RepID=A0AAV2ELZ2_9ROSI